MQGFQGIGSLFVFRIARRLHVVLMD